LGLGPFPTSAVSLPVRLLRGRRHAQRATRQVNQRYTISRLRAAEFDVFHPTYYDDYFLEDLGDKRLVVTVVDMIHELFPQYFSKAGSLIPERKQRLVERADCVIAISQSTRADVMRLLGVPADKVRVIYLGNSVQPPAGTPGRLPSLPERYVLFVGARKGYKNFVGFITAIAPLLRADRMLCVVCTRHNSRRRSGFRSGERRLFRQLGIEGQVVQCAVTDAALAGVYRHALCFVFPSLYEGFGLPVLEAFACDCPVILSNTSSLPEVGGEAVEYCDPTQAESIATALERVLRDDDLRADLVARGRAQLARFSWDACARETEAVYRDVVGSN